MKIFFANDGLRRLCNEDSLARKRFGEKGRKKIRQRLDEFDAANSLAELGMVPGPRCEELKGNRAGEFSVRIHDGYRIIFRPEEPVHRKPDGGMDWTRITQIRIQSIEDYHD